jgi:hypothetical protein
MMRSLLFKITKITKTSKCKLSQGKIISFSVSTPVRKIKLAPPSSQKAQQREVQRGGEKA